MILLIATASAFSPEVVHTWPATATTVAVLEGPDGPRVVTGGSTIQVWSGDGILDASVDLPAVALATTDLDDDGSLDLLACDSTGLVAVPWAPKAFGANERLDRDVCRAVATTDDGWLTGGDVVRIWSRLREQEDLDIYVGDGGVLLPFGNSFWAGTPGSSSLTFYTGDEAWTTSAVAPIGGLAEADKNTTWSLPDLSMVQDEIDSSWVVAEGPTTLGAGDLDADGEDEVVILHADLGAVGILRDGVETLIDGLGSPTALAVGTLEGACASILVIDGTEVKQIDVTDCGDDADADGDGFTVADGDCNDEEPLAGPGMPEICDGVDNDCDGLNDGRIDTLEVIYVVEEVSQDDNPLEGTTLHLTTYDAICGTGGRAVTWTFTGERAQDCISTVSESTSCRLADDGELGILAHYEGDYWAIEGSATVLVDNADPEVYGECAAGCGACADVEVAVGDVEDGIVLAADVPADELDCEVTGAPPGLEVDDRCVATWATGCADRGDWDVTVRASDDDGGETLDTVHLRAGCGSPFDACCSGSGFFSMLLMGSGMALRRRR